MLQNNVIKCCKMMSSNVALLHSNNCCVVLEPAICEDLDFHVAIFVSLVYRNTPDSQCLLKSHIFIACKQSLGRLYFYTCLSFCSRGVSLSQCMLGYTPRRADPPGADPPSRHPPGSRHPPWGEQNLLLGADTSPEADTSREQTPPRSRHSPGSRHCLPPVQCMLGDTGNKRVVCILLECILVDK